MNPRLLARYALYAATGFACLVVASAIAGSIRFLRPGPGFDFWGAGMPFLQAAIDGPWSWSLLWEMSAGAHRLAVSRILFLLEWWAGDFRNYYLLVFAWLALAGSALLVLRRVWQDQYLDQYSRMLCLFLVLMGFGSAQHINNLSYGFNLQWSFGLLFTLLFIDGVVQAVSSLNKNEKIYFAIQAGLAIFLLTFTTFSLPVVLCVWVFLAWGLRVRWTIALPVTAVLLLATVGYILYLPIVHDVKVVMQSTSGSGVTLWQVLAYFSVFTLRYLGSPVAEMYFLPGIALAVLALLVIAAAFWRVRVSKHHSLMSIPLLWMILAFSVFVILMALSTAMGRLTDTGAAISPRFRTFVLPFLTLAAIAWIVWIQQWRAGHRIVASLFLCLLSTIVVLPGHARLLHMFSDEYDDYVTPVVAMGVGLSNRDVVHEARMGLWWEDDNIRMMQYRNFLHYHRKGIYAEPYITQLGKTVGFKIAEAPNIASEHAIERLPGGGYQWKGLTDRCSNDGRVALVNRDGLVVGAGLVSRVLPDAGWRSVYRVFLPLCQSGEMRTWTAFLPLVSQPGDQVWAVIFVDGDAVSIASVVLP